MHLVIQKPLGIQRSGLTLQEVLGRRKDGEVTQPISGHYEGPVCPRNRKCLRGSLIEKEEIPGKREFQREGKAGTINKERGESGWAGSLSVHRAKGQGKAARPLSFCALWNLDFIL